MYTEVPKADRTGHFELRTGAMALKVAHDDRGRVRSVVYLDADRVIHEQRVRDDDAPATTGHASD